MAERMSMYGNLYTGGILAENRGLVNCWLGLTKDIFFDILLGLIVDDRPDVRWGGKSEHPPGLTWIKG
jgi:hypothetical protein